MPHYHQGTVVAFYDGSGIQDLCVYPRIPRIILIYGDFIGVSNSISIFFHLKRKHQLNSSKHSTPKAGTIMALSSAGSVC